MHVQEEERKRMTHGTDLMRSSSQRVRLDQRNELELGQMFSAPSWSNFSTRCYSVFTMPFRTTRVRQRLF